MGECFKNGWVLAIGWMPNQAWSRWSMWSCLRELIWLLPEHGFHPLNIESLRMHYAMTLDRWAEGFEKEYQPGCARSEVNDLPLTRQHLYYTVQ